MLEQWAKYLAKTSSPRSIESGEYAPSESECEGPSTRTDAPVGGGGDSIENVPCQVDGTMTDSDQKEPVVLPDLPPKVWVNVLSRLHWVPRFHARAVCRLFYDLVPHCFDVPEVITLNEIVYGFKDKDQPSWTDGDDLLAETPRAFHGMDVGDGAADDWVISGEGDSGPLDAFGADPRPKSALQEAAPEPMMGIYGKNSISQENDGVEVETGGSAGSDSDEDGGSVGSIGGAATENMMGADYPDKKEGAGPHAAGSPGGAHQDAGADPTADKDACAGEGMSGVPEAAANESDADTASDNASSEYDLDDPDRFAPFAFELDEPKQVSDVVIARMKKLMSFCTAGVVLNIRHMAMKTSADEFDPSVYVPPENRADVVGVVGGLAEELHLAQLLNLRYLSLCLYEYSAVNIIHYPLQCQLVALKITKVPMEFFASFRNEDSLKLPLLKDLFISFEDEALKWPGLNKKIASSLPDGAFPSLRNVYLRVKPHNSGLLKHGITDKVITLMRSFDSCPKIERVKLVVTTMGKLENNIVNKVNDKYWSQLPIKAELLLRTEAYTEAWAPVERSLGVCINTGQLLRDASRKEFGQSVPVPLGFDPLDVDSGDSCPEGLAYAVDVGWGGSDDSSDFFAGSKFGFDEYMDAINDGYDSDDFYGNGYGGYDFDVDELYGDYDYNDFEF